MYLVLGRLLGYPFSSPLETTSFMNGPFPSHWAEKIRLDLARLVSFSPFVFACDLFLNDFYRTLLTVSGKAQLNPFRFRSILFPVKNFFYNSSFWQFVTLNIWIGPNFYGYFVSFISSSFRFCLIPVLELFFARFIDLNLSKRYALKKFSPNVYIYLTNTYKKLPKIMISDII